MGEFADSAAFTDPARLTADHRRFHEIAVASSDVDPIYPVYRSLADRLGLDQAARAWLVFCHVAYYHAGSALAAFAATGYARDAAVAPIDVPVGTERRAHWTRPRLVAHLAALERAARPFAGDLWAWATEGLPDRPHAAWRELTVRLEGLDGNGRWAAFKTAEMLQQICGAPVAAPDMGHAHSSGPRHGLELLRPGLPAGNSPADIRRLDTASAELIRDLRQAGLHATVENTETTLCDFRSMWAGRYYVGHDIDHMQHQLTQVPVPFTEAAWKARADTLPRAYLGELNGWYGVDRDRRGHYRRTGEVIAR